MDNSFYIIDETGKLKDVNKRAEDGVPYVEKIGNVVTCDAATIEESNQLVEQIFHKYGDDLFAMSKSWSGKYWRFDLNEHS